MSAARVSTLTKSIRLIRLLMHFVSGLLQALLYPYFSRTIQNRMARRWARGFLHILNIELRTGNVPPCDQHKGVMLVANHISWLDILVILATFPVRFVAKAEIRSWPLLGWLSKRAGTLFIEREKRSDTLRTNRTIGELLTKGDSVAVFPEGMTSDGGVLHHFHASLLQPAVAAHTLLYPAAIRYRDPDGERNTGVAYVGISIVQSLLRILDQPQVEAALIFGPAIVCASRNRRELARLAEHTIAEELAIEIRRMADETASGLPAGQP